MAACLRSARTACLHEHNAYNFSLYPPQTLFVRGEGCTVFTLSVVRVSVRDACFFSYLENAAMDIHQFLQTH